MNALKKDYKDLVTNSHTVLVNDIEFIDENGIVEPDDDTLYVHYHNLDLKLLEEGEEVYLSIDKSKVNMFQLNALLDIIRKRTSLLNLRCDVRFEDSKAYFCFSK